MVNDYFAFPTFTFIMEESEGIDVLLAAAMFSTSSLDLRKMIMKCYDFESLL